MRRRSEHIFSMIKRTVPMLLAIGAVLSILLILYPQSKILFWGSLSVWSVGLLAAVSDLALGPVFKKKRSGTETEEKLTLERDRFLSDVAHELKTPLTVVRGAAEAMSDGTVPSEEYPQYCRRILRETEAMSRLVSDLLDVSRLRSGRVRFDPSDVDLAYLASALCEGLQPVAEEKGVTLSLEQRDTFPVLFLDRDRIRQLMIIFLDNALKHTPAGGNVTLFLDRVGDQVLVGVQDTGDGIAAEDIPYVFERYYKADPQRGGLAAGSGIGLSIAREIVLLHGGTVDVVSQIGEGSCFTARLPLREFKENETV